MQVKVLVVEDDNDLREVICEILEQAQFQVFTAANGRLALLCLAAQNIDLLVSDINMPEMDGYQLLKHSKQNFPYTKVIMMTAYGDISRAVKVMQLGAVDYLVKPFEPNQLLQVIKQYFPQGEVLQQQTIACAQSSKQLLQLASKVAQSDSTVLICGESGSGKEVLARYIHQHSNRASGPFCAINCAAIPENMLEAILFGHEKGAYTGAHSSEAGKFEQAQGGTLLLDEVSEMAPALQAKILRVLQEREVERVGGKKTIILDVRVLATTNKNLEKEVETGGFREDLYYRLNVFPLRWLPLRERADDILPLANRMLQQHAQRLHQRSLSIAADAELKLLNYPWPGNVRELDNVIQRALILCNGRFIDADDIQFLNSASIGPGIAVAAELSDSLPESMLGSDVKQHEFQLILQVLRQEQGSRKNAAIKLGISARTLRYKLAKMRDCGIDVNAGVEV